jgi:hypothetical protein
MACPPLIFSTWLTNYCLRQGRLPLSKGSSAVAVLYWYIPGQFGRSYNSVVYLNDAEAVMAYPELLAELCQRMF